MGALTSNRKRGDEYLTLNHGIPSLTSSKKPRFLSPSMNHNPISSKSAISKVSRYPDAKHPLPRLHAPCGNHRFGLKSSSREQKQEEDKPVSTFNDLMGNFITSAYYRAKTSAFAACRYLGNINNSIESERDAYDSNVEKIITVGASEDSSIEEIVVVEDEEGNDFDIERGNVRDSSPDTKMEDQIDRNLSPMDHLSNATLKVENLSLNVDPDMPGVLMYKKLLKAVEEERTPKLNQLSFDIKINELRRNILQSLRPEKKPLVEIMEIPREPFIPLTKEEEITVKRAFAENRRKVLVAHENSNISITGQILQCLRPGAWLNDEVINVYLELLKEREKRNPKSFLKCHFFNTFFYKKLILGNGYDYKSVRRWTTQRKLGYSLADCDKIFVPVHKEIHWCLAVIDKKEKKFQYLDSLGGRDNQVMTVLERYYSDEVKDKSGEEIDLSSWRHEFVEDLPEQQNGFDCGVFMIKYADFYSRGLNLCFGQENMPYFRKRTANEILRLRAE